MQIKIEDCFTEDQWMRILTLADEEQLPPAVVVTRLAGAQLNSLGVDTPETEDEKDPVAQAKQDYIELYEEHEDFTEVIDAGFSMKDYGFSKPEAQQFREWRSEWLDEQEAPDLDEQIDTMEEISGRTAGALKRAGIESLGQLLSLPMDEIDEIDRIGQAALEEIENAAVARDISLNDFGEYDIDLEPIDEEDPEEDTPEDVEEVLEEPSGDEIEQFRDLYKRAAGSDDVEAVKEAVALLAPYTEVQNPNQAKKKLAQDIQDHGFDPEDESTFGAAVKYLRNRMPIFEQQKEEVRSIAREQELSGGDLQEIANDEFDADLKELTAGQADALVELLEDQQEDQTDADALDEYF